MYPLSYQNTNYGDPPSSPYSNSCPNSLFPLVPSPRSNPNRSKSMALHRQPPIPLQKPRPSPRLDRQKSPRNRWFINLPNTSISSIMLRQTPNSKLKIEFVEVKLKIQQKSASKIQMSRIQCHVSLSISVGDKKCI